MKPEIENLKAWMSGRSTTGYQRALAMREFEQLLSYVTELEQLRQPPVSGELADFARFLSEEYSIEIHERIIDEWNKYYSANYR